MDAIGLFVADHADIGECPAGADAKASVDPATTIA
jgi:hypothetical protein